MNKTEKMLAKKVLSTFNSQSKNLPGFSREENLILERWKSLKIINEEAFVDVTSHGSDCKEYLQILGYPFTPFGEEEIKKDWYLQTRASKGIAILRDALTAIAFLVSLYLAISDILAK